MTISKFSTTKFNSNTRKVFGKNLNKNVTGLVDIPNLVNVQLQSYRDYFLQIGIHPANRQNIGLQEALNSIFPIHEQNASLEFIEYSLGALKFSEEECRLKGLTFARPLSVKLKLIIWESENKYLKSIGEDDAQQNNEESGDNIEEIFGNSEEVFNEKDEEYFDDDVDIDLDDLDNGENFESPDNSHHSIRDNTDDERKDKKLKLRLTQIVEQKIYLGDIPYMTDSATFIINGIERVLISELHRAPGVYYTQDEIKDSAISKSIFKANIIPYRGSWLECEFDVKEGVYFRIDKKKKISSITMFKALGMSNSDIIQNFYSHVEYNLNSSNEWSMPFEPSKIGGVFLDEDIADADQNTIIFSHKRKTDGQSNRKLTLALLQSFYRKGLKNIKVSESQLMNSYSYEDIYASNDKKAKLIIGAGEKFTPEIVQELKQIGITNLKVMLVYLEFEPYIRNLLAIESVRTKEVYLGDKAKHLTDESNKAICDIYKTVHGENRSVNDSKKYFDNLFFTGSTYDLSQIGRKRINKKFGITQSEDYKYLTKEDVIEFTKRLIFVRDGKTKDSNGRDVRYFVDDIDSLENRRIRASGEIILAYFYATMFRMRKHIVEKLSGNLEGKTPQDLILSKISFQDIFNSKTQYMDQTNPLAEVTHKKKVTSVGQGGVSRDTVSASLRDVHDSHYGRLCPIETPEGPNIGLILSLAVYADKDKYGFLTSPYAKVVNGRVTNQIVQLTYEIEKEHYIAIDTSIIDRDSNLIGKFDIFKHDENDESNDSIDDDLDLNKSNIRKFGYVECRKNGSYVNISPYEVEYINIAPNQVVSSSTASVPFIEKNDATRSLMGANMQRQAVPLNSLQTPIVATGMESVIARNSTLCITAPKDCIVAYVDSELIITRDINPDISESSNDYEIPKNLDLDILDEVKLQNNSFGIRVYNLKKFKKSNNNTCINQSPVVHLNQLVQADEVLANGFGIKDNELALGANVLVAMMSCDGSNYEDSIMVSNRLTKDDVFTSIKIDTYEIYVRDTKLGEEEVTRNIENIPQDMLSNLDENGIINVGTEIKPGSILVGKLTPKAESSYASYEKLLNALLHPGKSLNTKDTSFYAPFDAQGIVTSVNIFTRKGLEKNDRSLYMEDQQINKLRNKKSFIFQTLHEAMKINLISLLSDCTILKDCKLEGLILKQGQKLSSKNLVDLSINDLSEIKVVEKDNAEKLEKMNRDYLRKLQEINKEFEEEVIKLTSGDDLSQNVLMKIVITVASYSNRLQPGDKMCGRHGNKGVVAKIVPEEDMPFLEDGRSIDIVLNPLGVPGRMNIGQIYEIHLGLAYYHLKNKIAQLLIEFDASKIEIDIVKGFIKKIFNTEDQIEQIDNLSTEDFLVIAHDIAKGGVKFITPIFDGAREEDIKELLRLTADDDSGKVKLRSGKTGEFYDAPVTVGFKYMLKLHHMVEEKIHARSTGPYSLITQQPLGGRAQFGGQRLGEMEVWALEGYGAAHCLHEFLTIKSDDINGRNQVYSSILKKGYYSLYKDDSGLELSTSRPESYNVMSRELAALGLRLYIEKDEKGADRAGIRLMSPEEIIEISNNREVTKPETINYRTYKPDKGGLFCAVIFGPMRDNECLCGKSKKTREKNAVCEKCGVEMTLSRVRRERMGCIKLGAPVVHPWFLRSTSSRIAILLDKSLKEIEKIVYFNKYLVIDPGKTLYKKYDIVDELEYQKLSENEVKEEGLVLESGARALQIMLEDLDLRELRWDLQHKLQTATTETRRRKIIKRLKLVNGFLLSEVKPKWMIMDVLPVLPPDLRPLVALDGGKFASSDLNDLYRKVISRNNRLKRFISGISGLDQIDIIINNEKRMLQEAVDVLYDGPKKNKFNKGASTAPIKSLSDALKGKQGRFRQNLLGKRVDYSGRSVIVVGANLKLNECGIPKKMALELFKAWVQNALTSKPNANGSLIGIKEAMAKIKNPDDETWSILQEVVSGKIVLLNRAPTLHRLGIQAFRAKLIEGKAIQLHPLMCTAFNADFDGDQMAVHVPLSVEAQAEAEVLMMYNLFNPANGRPIVAPDKDMVLGIYYLTLIDQDNKYADQYFSSEEEALSVFQHGKISLHQPIYVRVHELELKETENVDISDENEEPNAVPNLISKIVSTTIGRIMLWMIVPRTLNIQFDLLNKIYRKPDSLELITRVYDSCGQGRLVQFVDDLKDIGFKFATISGFSLGMDDMIVPDNKAKVIEEANLQIAQLRAKFDEHCITETELNNKIIDIWSTAPEVIANSMISLMARNKSPKNMNAFYMAFDSGARGSKQQLKQIAAMRGLIVKSSGDILTVPIKSNFKEGLTLMEYFISTHGTRKGLSDIALKTANSGYLTRRLVDVAQDCMVTQEDCGTKNFITLKRSSDGNEDASISKRVYGRSSAKEIKNPITGEIIIGAGELIYRNSANLIESSADRVDVRSAITCEADSGVCAKCYGMDLSSGKLILVGEAVGIIAAQSIGEPGTQLTMRTFHIGGTATQKVEVSSAVSNVSGTVKLYNNNINAANYVLINSEGHNIVMGRSCEIVIEDELGAERYRHKVPYGARLFVIEKDIVVPGTKLASWDPYIVPIIAEKSGFVSYQDMIPDVSVKDVHNELTGINVKTVIPVTKKVGKALSPAIQLLSESGEVVALPNSDRYTLPVHATIMVSEAQYVSAGDCIARMTKAIQKNKDIVGGLPRVSELFEARKPKLPSIIAAFNGKITLTKSSKLKNKLNARNVIVLDEDISSEDLESGILPNRIEFTVPKNQNVLVQDGDFVKRGEVLVDGEPLLQEKLNVEGKEALTEYFVEEVQKVYRLQGVIINDKHIEVILKQMLSKYEVVDPGDTSLCIGERISHLMYKYVAEFAPLGTKQPTAKPIIESITNAALSSDSFLSSAAFQYTQIVLTEAAIKGSVDYLVNPKASLMTGELVNIGAGFRNSILSSKTELIKNQAINLYNIDIDTREQSEISTKI